MNHSIGGINALKKQLSGMPNNFIDSSKTYAGRLERGNSSCLSDDAVEVLSYAVKQYMPTVTLEKIKLVKERINGYNFDITNCISPHEYYSVNAKVIYTALSDDIVDYTKIYNESFGDYTYTINFRNFTSDNFIFMIDNKITTKEEIDKALERKMAKYTKCSCGDDECDHTITKMEYELLPDNQCPKCGMYYKLFNPILQKN